MTKVSNIGYLPDNCINLDHLPHIKGYDFRNKFDFSKFLKSFSTTGFQASNIGKAIEIIKAMRREKAIIFLALTSNMITSGIREIIAYLAEKKIINVIVTTAGAIEEDVIKTLKPFVLGDFEVKGKNLYEKGVNRAGNIFITNDRYTYFEKFLNPFLEEIYRKQKQLGRPLCASDFIYELGRYVNNNESMLYWASKNNIPVFCPAITDGALGGLMYFFRNRRKDFQLDIIEDLPKIARICLNAEKTGVIALGGGTAKHFALNAQIIREGCEYAVYINSGQEFDGSDSGAKTEEAITWGKIKTNAQSVKIYGDATTIFPIVIAGVLQGETKKKDSSMKSLI